MRPTFLLAVVFLAVLAVLAPLAPGVRGDEPPASLAVWTYDVRIVKVDTSAPDVVFVPPSFTPGADATTIRTPWSEVIAELKGRGHVTLLLDQRATALPGASAMLRQSRDRQIVQFSNRDLENERWQSSSVPSGASARLTTTETFTYEVEARWELAPQEGDLRAILGTSGWSGTHPALDGDTLVLTHREQVAYEAQETRGVEIYAFVTARLLGG